MTQSGLINWYIEAPPALLLNTQIVSKEKFLVFCSFVARLNDVHSYCGAFFFNLRGFLLMCLSLVYCFSSFAADSNLDSLGRYTAVVMPVLYNTTHRSRKRVFLMISVVWVLAFAVSCPLLFGFNTTGQADEI